jgi:acetolactate synthase-1/2/3 large subunit
MESSRSGRCASAIAAALADAGTTVLFGVPGGGGNLDLVEATMARGVRFVLSHGETAGALMAATHAELTGRPGACLATRGPGAASMVNGVAHALLDRVPLVAVVDGIALADRVRISHQRLDHLALFAPAAKAAVAIGADDADTVARAAVALALAAPAGPVLLDVVTDAGPASFPAAPVPEWSDRAGLERLVRGAARPVVLAGGAVREAPAALARLVAGTRIPVLTSYKAKGLAPVANDAGLLTGGTLELDVLRRADLVVAIGLDPVELIPAPWRVDVPVVAIGSYPTRDPYYGVAAEVVGPIAASLEGLVLNDGWDVEPAALRARALERLVVDVAGLDPLAVVLAAAATFAGALATVDAGAHMLVAMPFWPGRALISSGLATMGFALPAAIGAAIAAPGSRVVCITGDGGLGMCLAELETLARLDLPVTVVVLDDASLSLIAIKQRPGGHGGAAAVDYRPTDYTAIARAVGLPAFGADDATSLASALAAAAAVSGPALVAARVDPSGYAAVLAATRE